MALSLILAALRGFYLIINRKHNCRNIGKRIRSNTLPLLIPLCVAYNL
jgi:hypothetical protein